MNPHNQKSLDLDQDSRRNQRANLIEISECEREKSKIKPEII